MKKNLLFLFYTCCSLLASSQYDTSRKPYSIQRYIELNKPAEKLDTQLVIVYDTIYVLKEIDAPSQLNNKVIQNNYAQLDDKNEEQKIPSLDEVFSGTKIFWSIIILIGTYLVIRFLIVVLEKFAERSTNSRIGLKSISPFIRIIGWFVAIFWIIEGVFALSNEKLFAFLASAGLAIGIASQDILKNIFGGFLILFDRPFQVGDKIEVGTHYGEVKEIGIRSTRILTKDDSLVSLPNAEVVNKAVSNANTGEANCQVIAEIFLPIEADTNLARLIATEAAQVSRFVYLNKPITVLFFNEINKERSYLKMLVKAYVSDIRNEFIFKSDMTEIILKEFLQQGIFQKKDLE